MLRVSGACGRISCVADAAGRAVERAARAIRSSCARDAGWPRTPVCYGGPTWGCTCPTNLDTLGVEATEVRHDSAGRNVLIAVIGLVLAVAALIPLTWGAIWIGSIVYAGVVAFFTGGPAPEVSPT